MAKPSDELVARVTASFQTAEDVDYFFDKLNSPDWIPPLDRANFFKNPPEPISTDAGTQFPGWAASRYLARMASIDPGSVAKILRKLDDTKNVRVHHDLVDAVLELPPTLATEFVPKIVEWLDDRFKLLLPNKVGALLRKLALAGESAAALDIAGALFRVHGSESTRADAEDVGIDFPSHAVPDIDSFEFERLLEDCRSDLVRGVGLPGFEFLAGLLAVATEIEVGPGKNRRDSSMLWRPAIEPNAQNLGHGARDALVTAVRDAADEVVQGNIASLEDTASALEAYGWSVHRRIAMHLVRERAPARSDSVIARLLDRNNLESVDLHHEYWKLLSARYSELSSSEQRQILDMIDEGPAKFRDPDGPYAGEESIALEVWQVQALSAISEHLEGSDRELFDRLVELGRLGDHPEFLSYMSEWSHGDSSPLGGAEIEAMTIDELASFLLTWEPSDGWNVPTKEGLGRALQASVRANPIRYSENASKFVGIDPTYMNAMMMAFREVAINQEALAWEPVLELSKWVVDQERVVPGRTSIYGDLDTGWGWTRGSVGHLITAGLDDRPNSIPITMKSQVWSLLLSLSQDPDPTPESETKYGGSNMDPSDMAINTVRGQAIENVVRYALWVARYERAEGDSRTMTNFEIAPEVLQVLDAHVKLDAEPSLAVHSVFGQWFPQIHYLGSDWAVRRVDSIFPSAEDALLYWEAAWESYLSFSTPYNWIFEILRDQYSMAIDRLAIDRAGRRHPLQSLDRLAHHIMIFYVRGIYELEDPLMVGFFERASTELRASAISFVGRGLYTIVGDDIVAPQDLISDEMLKRITDLWNVRISRAVASDDATRFKSEIGEFGWWFVAPQFDESWLLEQLESVLKTIGTIDSGHLVVRRLAKMASTHPSEVLRCLRLMLQSDQYGWLILNRDTAVREILAMSLQSDESVIRDLAVEITHELGARGYREFRSLLE